MPSLYFKGKNAVWNHHLSVPYHTLEKNDKNSLKGKDEDENLIIHGDNLLALKALLPKYQGKVKCIYIDPPYNTGNGGWVYNDEVNSPLIQDWVGTVVGKEGEDLARHDKWLCMMTPRLALLKELLSEDGVIFISIDDNEVHHLKYLMNDIFGEENRIGEFIKQSKVGGGSDSKFIVKEHEYCLVYSKMINSVGEFFVDHKEDYLKRYKEKDEKGRYFWDTFARPGLKNPIKYTITAPDKSLIEGEWIRSKERFKKDLENGEIKFIKKSNGSWSVQFKQYLNESGKKPRSLSMDFGGTIEGKNALKELFKKDKVFEYPKSPEFIKTLIKIVTKDKEIILDSFAGSGTTAQAVLELNKEDENGNRKFILVEMEDYANKITAERVRKVIKQEKIKSGFTYYNLGPSIDADSILSGKLPTYKEFAKYVYYLATGKNHPEEKKIREKDYFSGKSGNESVYLIYKNNLSTLKDLAITLDWAEKVNKKDIGKKIVYAPACFLDNDKLEELNIQFVSIPYNLFEKK